MIEDSTWSVGKELSIGWLVGVERTSCTDRGGRRGWKGRSGGGLGEGKEDKGGGGREEDEGGEGRGKEGEGGSEKWEGGK